MAMPGNAASTLPVLATVVRAFRLLWLNRDDFLRVALVPVVASFLISLVAFGVGEGPGAASAAPATPPQAALWSWLLLGIADLALTTMFSIGWVRVLLLRAERSRRDLAIRWSRAHSRFLGRYLLLLIGIAVYFMVVGYLFAGALPADPAAALSSQSTGLVLIPAAVVAAYIFIRLSLVFAAAAVEHPYGFAESWRDTARRGFQILLSSLLAVTLVAVVYELILLALLDVAPLATILIQQALVYVMKGAGLTVLAIAFHRFSGWQETPPAPPAAA